MYYPQSGEFDEGPQRGPTTRGKGLKALPNPLLPLAEAQGVTLAMSPLQRPAQYGYRAGSPWPYEGGRTLRGRLSSLPGARRNGRASASLTARGGGLPIGVMGLEEAIARGKACREGGADVIFIEAP